MNVHRGSVYQFEVLWAVVMASPKISLSKRVAVDGTACSPSVQSELKLDDHTPQSAAMPLYLSSPYKRNPASPEKKPSPRRHRPPSPGKSTSTEPRMNLGHAAASSEEMRHSISSEHEFEFENFRGEAHFGYRDRGTVILLNHVTNSDKSWGGECFPGFDCVIINFFILTAGTDCVGT